MQRDREQFWLIASCVIVIHAVALAVTTFVWANSPASEVEPSKSIEVAVTDPVVIVKEIEPDQSALGEASGTGDSIATVDAPQPSVTDKPDDIEQAWTRQQPQPLPKPAAGEVKEHQRVTPAREPAEAEQVATAFGPVSVTAMLPLAVTPPKSAEEDSPTERSSEQRVEQKPAEEPKTEAVKASELTKPTEPELASSEKPEPAEQGESDLDPFAKEEGVSFTPGGTIARQGREVKMARPRIDLGFMADATRMSGRDLVVRMSIETDGVGHPTRVQVVDSSGSNTIDDAVRLAMYDSWFGGKMPVRFPFTVRFVRR